MKNQNKDFFELSQDGGFDSNAFSKWHENSLRKLEYIRKELEPRFKEIDSSHKSKQEKDKSKNELMVLQYFIYYFDSKISIVEQDRESPDAIILRNGKYIGVEVSEIIFNKGQKAQRNMLNKALKRVEKLLNSDKAYSKYQGLYKIEFGVWKTPGSWNIRNKEFHDLEKELEMTFKRSLEPSSISYLADNKYIKSIKKIYPFNSIKFSFSGSMTGGRFAVEPLEEALIKKENKLKNYLQSNIHEHWLLLFTSDMERAGFYGEIGDDILKRTFDSSFNRVFILGKGKVFELKIKQP